MNILFTTQFDKSDIFHKAIFTLMCGMIGFSLISCDKTPPADSVDSELPISDAVVHPVIPMPMSYDTQSWQTDNITPIDLSNIEEIVSAFGTPTAIDENSLDYSSQSAIKYRFVDNDDPYLDIINSEKYLEIGWYYANPNDTDEEKATSLAHAKKAYKLAQQLLGDEGKVIVTNILNGKIIKNKELSKYKIALAKCEFYSCMLIIDKSAINQETQQEVEKEGVAKEDSENDNTKNDNVENDTVQDNIPDNLTTKTKTEVKK